MPQRFTSWKVHSVLVALSVMAVGRAGGGAYAANNDLLTLGDSRAPVLLQPGEAAEWSVRATDRVVNIAGLDLTLDVAASPGAPPLTVTYVPTDQTKDWLFQPDSQNPYHAILVGDAGLAGPAELLKMTVTVSGSAPFGTWYAIRVAHAQMASALGVTRNVTAQTAAPAMVAVLHTPLIYGDLNQNGSVDSSDIGRLLEDYVTGATPSPVELLLADVRPKPGMNAAFGNGRIDAADLNWIVRRLLGLVTAP